MLVHPEPIDADWMDRSLFRVELVGAHQERALRDPGHVLARWPAGGLARRRSDHPDSVDRSRAALLARHRHTEALFWRDEVVGVLGILAKVDLHPVDLAVETAGLEGVFGTDRRAGLVADVCRLVR